ncbi:MAG: glycosyltransferase family 4 protein [Pseudomonadota bacterium]
MTHDPVAEAFAALQETRPLAGRRILILVENLPLPFDRRVWQEARTLTAAGAEVEVICPKGRGFEADHEVLEGVRIHRHPLPVDASGALGYVREYGAALFHQARLAQEIYAERPFDTVQACNPPDLLFLIARLFRRRGVRFIFDHHDICPELYEAKFGKRDLFWRLMGRLERASFAAADVSLATNESYARIARERGGMAAEDVFVVRSGPDAGRLRPSAPNPDWRKGRDHLIGYVGVMGDQEGLDLLLESARILCLEQGRSVQFALVGGGPALEGLRAQAEAMGLADHVTFAGRAPDTELFEVLSTADVCVNPDRVNPMNDLSTMNKIMEYMAFERPIVQFEVTEGRVSAGEASLYAAPNDPADMAAKLAQLLEDAPARARMGAFGRRRVVEELGWERQIEPLIAAYLRAAEKPAAAGSGAGTGTAGAGAARAPAWQRGWELGRERL